ncbi:MAG: Gfo/Idh/MocA family protein [Bryobacteraceae bacterium]
MNRRQFLGSAAALPLLNPQRVMGANDRIRLGFIGTGGRGSWLLGYELPGAEVVAVADCAQSKLEAAVKAHPESARWTKYNDYRRLLEHEKLDAVFVETCTHARVLILMHALQAGLDVYGEKPLTLTVAEGITLRRAVQKYQRVLQTGTQQRSMPANMYASKLVREGAIGFVHTVIACNFEPPMTWIPRAPMAIPEGLDWEQWCNQTELRQYHPELQYGWGSYRAYDGGGQSWGVTGWGTHALDQVQCALGTDATGPTEIWQEETGATKPVFLRYMSGTVLKLIGPKRDHADLGAIFYGTNGRIEIKRGVWETDRPELMKGAPDPTPEGRGEDLFHLVNFLDCMRSRQLPNAHFEVGHRSTTVCQLINICRELARPLRWDPGHERFFNDSEADGLLHRARRKGYELPPIEA